MLTSFGDIPVSNLGRYSRFGEGTFVGRVGGVGWVAWGAIPSRTTDVEPHLN